jgi:hypothetical protein
MTRADAQLDPLPPPPPPCVYCNFSFKHLLSNLPPHPSFLPWFSASHETFVLTYYKPTRLFLKIFGTAHFVGFGHNLPGPLSGFRKKREMPNSSF